jgi:hypothetical protein
MPLPKKLKDMKSDLIEKSVKVLKIVHIYTPSQCQLLLLPKHSEGNKVWHLYDLLIVMLFRKLNQNKLKHITS